MTEEDTFNRLRREPFHNTFVNCNGGYPGWLASGNDDTPFISYLQSKNFNLDQVTQYGWTPEEFIEYAREHYEKDSVTK